MRDVLVVGLVVVAGILPAARAAAHPQIDEAARLYEQGEFEAALELLAEAESGGGLERGDVLSLLITRVLIHVGTGDEEAYRRDLAHIALLDPDYRMGPAFPPLVRQTFAAIRQEVTPVELDARAEAVPAALRVSSTLADEAELVTQVRINARVSGGPWRREAAGSLEVPAPAGAQVDWYVEAVGPGGLVVASVGSAESPRRDTLPGGAAAEPVRPPPGGDVDEGGSSAWIWIGLAVVVLAGAAVGAYFLFFDDPVSDQTEIARPML